MRANGGAHSRDPLARNDEDNKKASAGAFPEFAMTK